MSLLPELKLEVFCCRWEFAAKHVLMASDPESLGLDELLALGTESEREAFAHLALGYTPTQGSDELRAAIAATYRSLQASDVLCLAGAEEALYWLLHVCAVPGSHVILTLPGYPSIETLALAGGAQVTGVPLDADQGWSLDLDRLAAAIRPTTRLLITNFPNNPTGAIPNVATFEALAQLCDERGIRLVCDEMLRGLELDPVHQLPQAADLSPTAVSLNGMSKSLSLPGLRVGWLACRDTALLNAIERQKHYTSVSNAGPSEFLATLALAHREEILARNLAILQSNVPLFEAFFTKWNALFAWERPRGGCTCFPRYTGPESVEDFCQELVEQEGVFLAPASPFLSTLVELPKDRFRVGLGRRNPSPGLDAFARYLDRKHPRMS